MLALLYNWLCLSRFVLKIIQLAISIYLIFSLYNVGIYWIFLIAVLAVPIHGFYLILASPRRTLYHPLPYVRYKAMIRLKNWMKLDYAISATMSCVCFGFSIILFFGYVKVSFLSSYILRTALASLILTFFYISDAFITGGKIRALNVDLLYVGHQPRTEKSQHSTVKGSAFCKFSNRIMPAMKSARSEQHSNIPQNMWHRSSPQSNTDSSLSDNVHKESLDCSIMNDDPMAANAYEKYWLRNKDVEQPTNTLYNPKSSAYMPPSFDFKNGAKPSDDFGPKISFCRGPRDRISQDYNSYREHIPVTTIPFENRQVVDANVNVDGILRVTTPLPRFSPSGNTFTGRKKSSPAVLSPTSSMYSAEYKVNTEPYNRRAIPPNITCTMRNNSVNDLRTSRTVHLAQSTEIDRKRSLFNSKNISVIPQVNMIDPTNSTADYEIDRNADGIHYAVKARVVPHNTLNGLDPVRNYVTTFTSSSTNSESINQSVSDSSNHEHISSSISTVPADAAVSSSPNENGVFYTGIVNDELLLTSIATAIDSAREMQIRSKNSLRRQKLFCGYNPD